MNLSNKLKELSTILFIFVWLVISYFTAEGLTKIAKESKDNYNRLKVECLKYHREYECVGMLK